MPSVVLIDDDHGPVDYYVQALRSSDFEVEHLDTVDSALKHVENASEPADLYILDVMVPPGDSLDLRESSYGLTSGLVVYERLRERFPGVPVIILTNISTPEILDALPVGDQNTTIEAKVELLPFDLVDRVRQRLERRQWPAI
jgi:DNA-binding response OmpR family regulator